MEQIDMYIHNTEGAVLFHVALATRIEFDSVSVSLNNKVTGCRGPCAQKLERSIFLFAGKDVEARN